MPLVAPQTRLYWARLSGQSWVSSRLGRRRVVAKVSLGLVFSKIMKFTYSKGWIDRDSYTAQYVALAIFTIGIVSSIGSDDLLAAFAAGRLTSATGLVVYLYSSIRFQVLRSHGTAISRRTP